MCHNTLQVLTTYILPSDTLILLLFGTNISSAHWGRTSTSSPPLYKNFHLTIIARNVHNNVIAYYR